MQSTIWIWWGGIENNLPVYQTEEVMNKASKMILRTIVWVIVHRKDTTLHSICDNDMRQCKKPSVCGTS